MLPNGCRKRWLDDRKKYDLETPPSVIVVKPETIGICRIVCALFVIVFPAYIVFEVYQSGDILSDWFRHLDTGPLPPAERPDQMIPMAVVNYGDMTYERFYREFRQADRPFVMKNIPVDQRPCFGGLGPFQPSLLNECTGHVRLYKRVPGSAERKGLHEFEHLNYTYFVQLLSEEGGFERLYGKGHYFGHGEDIRKQCPFLWKHLRVPSYFTGEVHLRGMQSWSGIEFMMSTNGMNQTFHVDIPKSELVAQLCSGRKRYRVIPRSVAAAKIGWGDTLHLTLLKRPEDWPLGLPVYYGEAGPGDFIYAPAGAVHAVDNLETGISIINTVMDVGKLGPVSWVNKRLIRAKCVSVNLGLCFHAQPWLNILGMMTNTNLRTEVFDSAGAVTEASKIPEGFPTWGQLDEWINR